MEGTTLFRSETKLRSDGFENSPLPYLALFQSFSELHYTLHLDGLVVQKRNITFLFKPRPPRS